MHGLDAGTMRNESNCEGRRSRSTCKNSYYYPDLVPCNPRPWMLTAECLQASRTTATDSTQQPTTDDRCHSHLDRQALPRYGAGMQLPQPAPRRQLDQPCPPMGPPQTWNSMQHPQPTPQQQLVANQRSVAETHPALQQPGVHRRLGDLMPDNISSHCWVHRPTTR